MILGGEVSCHAALVSVVNNLFQMRVLHRLATADSDFERTKMAKLGDHVLDHLQVTMLATTSTVLIAESTAEVAVVGDLQVYQFREVRRHAPNLVATFGKVRLVTSHWIIDNQEVIAISPLVI